MRPQVQTQIAWPRPGKVIIGLIVANVVAYVLQLILLRANQGWVVDLYLSPAGIFERGQVWQLVTHGFLHSPQDVFHLIFNMLWLWLFGSRLEKWWGEKRFLWAYFVFLLGGAALTLLVGLLSKTAVLSPLLPSFWVRPHLGASGAVMGVVASWGLVYANEEMHFFLLGRMKGKTFVLIIIAIELLRALSFDGVSSTSHFGGMLAGLVLCRGLWRPSKWQEIFRRARLQKQRRRVEHELKVLEGGKGTRGPDGPPKGPDPKDPKYWN
ncbi:MAG: rhomboid family intramembrane serine protease [Deltaproteobacteria bacterium]|nr:rhomboid family intramembrane serine protease [Deltaproteobacteria bacterium]